MAFINATWVVADSRISLNVDNIVAVSDNNGKAVIHTTVPKKDGYAQFWLNDSYESILDRINQVVGR